ncbi:MAG: hypothetical protein NZ693_06155, partial [Thermoflexales bacterium]|nr:hypothetical protein [Thermoflexales bacterium]
VEMLNAVQQRGFRVREVPIIFEDRVRGVSKISSSEILRAALTVGRLMLSRLSKSGWRARAAVAAHAERSSY